MSNNVIVGSGPIGSAIAQLLVDRGDTPDEIVEYVAGMTDRFALAYAANL